MTLRPCLGKRVKVIVIGWILAAAGGGLALARPWQKVVTPRFTLITDAPDFASRRLLTDFSDYLLYLDKAVAMGPQDLKPMTLVLFDNPKEYSAFEAKLSNGLTVEATATEREFYAGSQTGVGPSWAAISAVAEDLREETRHVVFVAGAEWYLDSLDQPMPPAVQRGLSVLFAGFERGVTHGIVGKPLPGLARVLRHDQISAASIPIATP